MQGNAFAGDLINHRQHPEVSPVFNRSITKSIDHFWFGASATSIVPARFIRGSSTVSPYRV